MINPINHSNTKEKAEKYKVEPYVIAADVYGAGNLLGQGGWTWYTGSSSWYYKAGIEYILGLKIKNGELSINPCIPKEWNTYSIKYKYKTSTYNINVLNLSKNETSEITSFKQDTSQIKSFKLDGEEIPDKKIKLQDTGQTHEIEIAIQ